MWVPWRAGATAHEQARARAGRKVKGQMRAEEARVKELSRKRKDLFKQAKQGKITNAEYQKALRKLGK